MTNTEQEAAVETEVPAVEETVEAPAEAEAPVETETQTEAPAEPEKFSEEG